MIPAQRDRRRKNMAFSGTFAPTSMTRTVASPTGSFVPTWKDGLGATITPMHTALWVSSQPGFATVSQAGLVTRVANGGPFPVTAQSGRAGISGNVTTTA